MKDSGNELHRRWGEKKRRNFLLREVRGEKIQLELSSTRGGMVQDPRRNLLSSQGGGLAESVGERGPLLRRGKLSRLQRGFPILRGGKKPFPGLPRQNF